MARTMMACGCVSQSHRVTRNEDGTETRVPSCFTHDTTEQAPMPDMTGRRSKCAYNNPRGRCKVEVDSNADLPFFKHCPDKPFDEHYCGCMGWG